MVSSWTGTGGVWLNAATQQMKIQLILMADSNVALLDGRLELIGIENAPVLVAWA
jgi:hypothetical protein